MHAAPQSETVFDIGALTQIECVAELLARENVKLIESHAFGCGTGVFAYQTADLRGILRTFVGVLLLDESVALASLTVEDASRLCDLINDATLTPAGRTTKILSADRPVPACDALGFDANPGASFGRGTLAVERLRVEDGYPCPGIGLWYEPGQDVDQPGDEMFAGGFTAFSLDQAEAVIAALRTVTV